MMQSDIESFLSSMHSRDTLSIAYVCVFAVESVTVGVTRAADVTHGYNPRNLWVAMSPARGKSGAANREGDPSRSAVISCYSTRAGFPAL